MTGAVSFDTLEVGDELPVMRLTLAGEQVARYARTSNMPGRRFLSDEAAREEGLPGQIVPGNMSMALFSRMLTDWRPQAFLVRLSCTFRGFVRPRQALALGGVITEKRAGERGNFVECDLILENEEGERQVTGSAVVMFPSTGS